MWIDFDIEGNTPFHWKRLMDQRPFLPPACQPPCQYTMLDFCTFDSEFIRAIYLEIHIQSWVLSFREISDSFLDSTNILNVRLFFFKFIVRAWFIWFVLGPVKLNWGASCYRFFVQNMYLTCKINEKSIVTFWLDWSLWQRITSTSL